MPSQWAFEGGILVETARSPDRAQLYGDALFETILWSGRHLALKSYHLSRLLRGCERLDIGLSFAEASDYLGQLEESLTEGFRGSSLAVRLMCTPVSEGRRYARSSQTGVSLSSLITSFQPSETSYIDLGVSAVRLGLQPLTAGLKHANRLEQVLGASQLERAGFEDGIMLSVDDSVVCTTRANVYALIDETWLTPVLDLAGVAGTRRAWLFDSAPELGLVLEESQLTRACLERAQAVMVSNALRGFVAVANIAGRPYQKHNSVHRIQQAYQAYLDGER